MLDNLLVSVDHSPPGDRRIRFITASTYYQMERRVYKPIFNLGALCSNFLSQLIGLSLSWSAAQPHGHRLGRLSAAYVQEDAS